MTDLEIYDLAISVVSSIAKDLNNNIYSRLGGVLSVSWKTDEIFNASAQSNSKVDEPPVHTVNMYYELARQLYRDIEEYYAYIESECDKPMFDALFGSHHKYQELISSISSKADYKENMFSSALTWIFFHEIAHLNQEHGYIRSQILQSDNHLIDECNVYKSENLEGKSAAIYHTTEMAADFEAVYTCIKELIRHSKGVDLEGSIGSFVGALFCALYKFHDTKSLNIDSIPKGTHPSVIVRLEHLLPHIWEFFDIAKVQSVGKIKLSRSELIYICELHSATVGLFWFRKQQLSEEKFNEFLHTRTIDRTGGREYMQIIINTWDEIEAEIINSKRSSDPLSLISFTDQYRNIVFEKVES